MVLAVSTTTHDNLRGDLRPVWGLDTRSVKYSGVVRNPHRYDRRSAPIGTKRTLERFRGKLDKVSTTLKLLK